MSSKITCNASTVTLPLSLLAPLHRTALDPLEQLPQVASVLDAVVLEPALKLGADGRELASDWDLARVEERIE